MKFERLLIPKFEEWVRTEEVISHVMNNEEINKILKKDQYEVYENEKIVGMFSSFCAGYMADKENRI